MYVDGFVVPVPKKNTKAYMRIAKKLAAIWREHGALSVTECAADDVKVGKWTSFPRAVKLKKDETVVFSWITYKSRKDRDLCNKKVMADPRVKDVFSQKNMPFDGKRLIFGGFKVAVEV
jgi:uncharacterized protein YbaA (DUF1428 family)